MAKVVQNQQLTFNRMREINMWSRAFNAMQWCLAGCALLALLGICSRAMWSLGELGMRAFPVENDVARGDVLYSSWRVPPAVFYAVVSMCLAVGVVRVASNLLWRRPRLFRPALNPAIVTWDFVKLSTAVALCTTLLFLATFYAEYHLPGLPAFLKPPSPVQTMDPLRNFMEWAGTRGVQFVLVAVGSVLLAQKLLGVSRFTIVPRRHVVPVLAAYTVLFELFYTLSGRWLSFLFYGSFDQAQQVVSVGVRFLLAMLIFEVLFWGCMYAVGRRLVRPIYPVECKVVLAGVSYAGKTRFFGEALRTIGRMNLRGFYVNLLGSTDDFLRSYNEDRRKWKLLGTVRPDTYSFSIEKLDEVIRFHWQDIPGGVTSGTINEPELLREWKDELHSANALCVFFDAEELAKGPLSDYQSFETLKRAPFEFIRELKVRNDFERPPVICIVATKIDRLNPTQERAVRRSLQEFASECRTLIAEAGLPRGYVGVRMTSTMMNMRGVQAAADATDMASEPVQHDCGQTLMWVAAKIIEAKSLGLDGPSAAIRGKATPFGELQIDLEEFAS